MAKGVISGAASPKFRRGGVKLHRLVAHAGFGKGGEAIGGVGVKLPAAGD